MTEISSRFEQASIAAKSLPLSNTLRFTSIKYDTGLNRVIFCAHSGMLSIGVNNPLINTKIIRKNHDMNIACCWVLVIVDTNIPKPRIATR